MEPFAVFDCSLARCPIGQSCSNLRELLAALHSIPDNVLEHHMLRCTLEDHFELYEFPNDLARWCWDALGDHVVGEQLGLVDPYTSIAPLLTCAPSSWRFWKIGFGIWNVFRGADRDWNCICWLRGSWLTTQGNGFLHPWRWPRRFPQCHYGRCFFTYTKPVGAQTT